MSINTQKTQDIKVPVLPESVKDATVATWYKTPGEFIKRDEKIVDIETDKVVLEVAAPFDGSIEAILKPQGAVVSAEEVIAVFKAGEPAGIPTPLSPALPKSEEMLSPASRRKRSETELPPTPKFQPPMPSEPTPSIRIVPLPSPTLLHERIERRVPMSRLRARIAERLLQAQQTSAILTTFNEINMQPVMALRKKYKELFEKIHGVRFGFMSFFVTATVEALKRFPLLNASIENEDILYHDYYDIGIAVSSPKGLVVPVLRNAETLNMAGVEKQIALFGEKAKGQQLSIEELSGGTFTISNGGIFGSLMSTPILNPPQSGILGMHKIEERAVVENGVLIIQPMMYVALSYDHRLIDGSESVRFLVTIKELLEDPTRLLLGI